jgi:hypothetical protein
LAARPVGADRREKLTNRSTADCTRYQRPRAASIIHKHPGFQVVQRVSSMEQVGALPGGIPGIGSPHPELADGCMITMPTRAWAFGYPRLTRSVGVHFKPWGQAPFLPMPAAELCDRPVTVEQVWGRPAVAELRDRLATADGPHEILTLLEEELLRRLRETAGLGLVRRTSSVIAATRYVEVRRQFLREHPGHVMDGWPLPAD